MTGTERGQAGPYVDPSGGVEGVPGVEHRLPHPGPVGAAAPVVGEPPGVDEQHLRLRGCPVGPAQHPQVQRHAVGGAAPAGSATTARSAPRRSRSALIRRPERRDATAGGISRTAVPPSRSRASACCTQASSDSVRAGEAVLPARVVGEVVVAPVALVERRVAEHGVGPQLRVRVGPQGVAGGGVHGRAGVQGEAQGGEGGELRRAVLGVEPAVGAVGEGAEQGAGAAGGVEDGGGGVPARAAMRSATSGGVSVYWRGLASRCRPSRNSKVGRAPRSAASSATPRRGGRRGAGGGGGDVEGGGGRGGRCRPGRRGGGGRGVHRVLTVHA